MGNPITALKVNNKQSIPTITVDVVICAYTYKRWEQTIAAIESIEQQTYPASKIILVIDNNPELLSDALNYYESNQNVCVIANDQAKGLAGARNTGVAVSSADVVAFIDDDAAADARWLEHLIHHYSDKQTYGVGGSIHPQWPLERPRWWPPEFDWVVGCTYTGLPTAISPIRNFIGCNMSVRREILSSSGGFSSKIGRIEALPVGCEETELCIRIKQQYPEAKLIYDPAVQVSHHVSDDRVSLRYFLRRCYFEGTSKAIVSQLVGASSGLSSERAYTFKTLPKAFFQGIASISLSGIARSLVILAGLSTTTFGYGRGLAIAAATKRTHAGDNDDQ